jgi:hypothetical protein
MRTVLVSAVALVVLLAPIGALAQQAPSSSHQHEQSQTPSQAPTPKGGGMHGGMTGGMHGGGMGGMHGGMMGGGMCGMIGGGMTGGMAPMMGAASDPKMMSRMLQLRGEIMKAVGELLIKHAQALEAAPTK